MLISLFIFFITIKTTQLQAFLPIYLLHHHQTISFFYPILIWTTDIQLYSLRKCTIKNLYLNRYFFWQSNRTVLSTQKQLKQLDLLSIFHLPLYLSISLSLTHSLFYSNFSCFFSWQMFWEVPRGWLMEFTSLYFSNWCSHAISTFSLIGTIKFFFFLIFNFNSVLLQKFKIKQSKWNKNSKSTNQNQQPILLRVKYKYREFSW